MTNTTKTYYESRVALHEQLHEALVNIAGSGNSIRSKVVASFLGGVMLACAIGIILFVMGNSVQVGLMTPLLVILLFVNQQSFKNESRAVQDGSTKVAELIRDSLLLRGMQGAPQDRLEDKKSAGAFLNEVQESIRIRPPQAYRVADFATRLSARIVGFAAIYLTCIEASAFMWTVAVVAVVTLCIASHIYGPIHRAFQQEVQGRADNAAYSLAEFGLRSSK